MKEIPSSARQSMCGSKTRFKSEELAKRVAKCIRREGECVYPYKCVFCHRFHLGH